MLEPGKHELHTEAQLKAERRRWIDGELRKLQALARQRGDRRDAATGEWLGSAEAADDELTRALGAKTHLYRTGSFAKLDVALFALRLQYPLRYDSLVEYVIEATAKPTPPVRAHLDETVIWIAERLPRPILLPADAAAEMAAWKRSLQHGKTPEHKRQREARDLEIFDLIETHGWSLRRVGRVYDLSPEGVRHALERSTSAAPVATAVNAA